MWLFWCWVLIHFFLHLLFHHLIWKMTLGNYILFYFWSFIKINFQSIAFYLCAAFWVNVFSSFSSPIFSLCVADNLFNPHPFILSFPNVFFPHIIYDIFYFQKFHTLRILCDLCQSPIPCSFKKNSLTSLRILGALSLYSVFDNFSSRSACPY